MKIRIFAIIQLVILVLYIFSPILPHIDYAINKDYIAKNLCVKKEIPNNCCQGKCYLNKQIQKSEETNNSKETNSNKKVQSKEVHEFIVTNFKLPKIAEINSNILFFKQIANISTFSSIVFVPPKT